jgi:hypothetical protein
MHRTALNPSTTASHNSWRSLVPKNPNVLRSALQTIDDNFTGNIDPVLGFPYAES